MKTSVWENDLHNSDYQLVEAAIRYLQRHQVEQPAIDTIARSLGVSAGHLHRLFRKWVGLTPKQFLQSLTVAQAKAHLAQSDTLLDTAMAVGLSGPSRLHDHFVVLEGMTPAEYRSYGETLRIEYGSVASPFGEAFVAVTERGICQLGFADGEDGEDGLARLRKKWPRAKLSNNQTRVTQLLAPVWKDWRAGTLSLKLLVKGSNFQIQVWRALLDISPGKVVDYATIAQRIGQPSATRAVASAIGQNPIACLIPCHRVIRRDGGLGGYHWGLPRKSLLLAQELYSTDRLQ